MSIRTFVRRCVAAAAPVAVPALALLLSAGPLFAAQQGRIRGTVTDGAGKPIEGVKVTITTKAITNFKLELTSNKDGKWATILNDATLLYNYRFDKETFASVSQDKKVPIGGTEDLNIQMLNQQQMVEKGLVKQVVDPFTQAYNDTVDKFQGSDMEAAMAAAENVTKLGPEKANGFDLAAKVAFKKQAWDKVIEWGEKSLTLEADNPPLYGMLMDAYKAKGDKAKTAEYQKKYAAANPDKPELLYNQAVELFNKGDFKGADPILRKVVDANPDYAPAQYLFGMTCVNLNKVPDMKKAFQAYLKLEPNGKDAGTAKEMLDAFK